MSIFGEMAKEAKPCAASSETTRTLLLYHHALFQKDLDTWLICPMDSTSRPYKGGDDTISHHRLGPIPARELHRPSALIEQLEPYVWPYVSKTLKLQND